MRGGWKGGKHLLKRNASTNPAALLAIAALCGSSTATSQEKQMKEAVDFGTWTSLGWGIVNDGVMGGRSASSMERTPEGTAIFKGILSFELEIAWIKAIPAKG